MHGMYWGMFSGRKAKIDTTWSVPKCFPGCAVSCITIVTVIQWYFLPFHVRKMFKENKKFLEKQKFLERQFIAQSAATMIYYEDCMTLPG